MLKPLVTKWRGVLLLTAAAFLVILPTMINGIPRGDDIEHHYRVSVSLYESIIQGEFHPGWNSLSGDGYGDVTFRLYPPMFYYLMSLSRLITGNWYGASVFTFGLLSLLGGLGIYYWARTLLEPNLALCAGLLFIVSPFNVSQIYQSFMLPQFAACAILPFAFAFEELICRTGKWRYVIGLAAAYGMLLSTHLPSTVIGSIALSIYGLFRIERSTYVKVFVRLALGVLLGFAASAFYWVRMISELAWRLGDRGAQGFWYDYRYNFLFGNTADSTTVWWATRLAAATLLMALPALVLLRKSARHSSDNHAGVLIEHGLRPTRFNAGDKNSWQGNRNQPGSAGLRAIGILTVISFFMMTPLSRKLWDAFLFLQEVQLPWRWLTLASMFGSILGAASLPGLADLAKSKLRPVALLGAGCLLIAVSLTFLQVIRGANFLPRSTFDPMIETIASSKSLSYWLPVWASDNPRAMSARVEAADRQVQITAWKSEQRAFHIDAGSTEEARLKTYYYPHWVATALGAPLKTRPADDGALLIALPAEAATVDVMFIEPPISRISDVISIVAWGMIGIFMLILLIRTKGRKAERAPTPENPPLEVAEPAKAGCAGMKTRHDASTPDSRF